MWFPNICKTATIKKTGRTVNILEIFNDHIVYVDGPKRFLLNSYALSELELHWPDCIPPEQRCDSTVFANLVEIPRPPNPPPHSSADIS